MGKSIRGAALIIILFIAAILASISVLLVVKSKSHIERISIIKDYMKAEREVITDINHFIFVTQTSPFNIMGESRIFEFDKSNLPQGINLKGIPFKYRNSEFIVQDVGGLIPILPVYRDSLTRYLTFAGWQDKQIYRFLDTLEDWLDNDDFQRLSGAERQQYGTFGYPLNQPLQSIKDIGLFTGIEPELLASLVSDSNLVLYGVGKQTNGYAPNGLLPFYFPTIEAQQIRKNRDEEKTVDVAEYSTGNWIIKVNASHLNAQSSKLLRLTKRFGDIRPFVITKWQDREY